MYFSFAGTSVYVCFMFAWFLVLLIRLIITWFGFWFSNIVSSTFLVWTRMRCFCLNCHLDYCYLLMPNKLSKSFNLIWAYCFLKLVFQFWTKSRISIFEQWKLYFDFFDSGSSKVQIVIFGFDFGLLIRHGFYHCIMSFSEI